MIVSEILNKSTQVRSNCINVSTVDLAADRIRVPVAVGQESGCVVCDTREAEED